MNIRGIINNERLSLILWGTVVFLTLYIISAKNYLLFHSLAEIFSIIVAFSIFMICWNSRQVIVNNYFIFIGVAYLFVGGMDTIHTLAYKGLSIFHGYETNLSTQLWISTRYLESISLLLAPFFIRRKLKINLTIWIYILAVTLILLSIFYWGIFPDCFIEGAGLTAFKVGSEYIICSILIASLVVMWRNRSGFDPTVLRMLMASIVITIASEISFTFYIHAYGLSNFFGHIFKIISFYLIYKAIIETGLKRPYNLLFRDLKNREEELSEYKDNLEVLVAERTDELKKANELLEEEIISRKQAEEELREARDQLYQAQKMESLGTMISGVAHEINNPVSLIMINAPIIRKVWHDFEPIMKEHESVEPDKKFGGLTYDFLAENFGRLISDIEMAADRIARFVGDLKSFAAKSRVIDKKPISVNNAVDNIIRLAQTTIRKSKIDLQVDLPDNIPLINGDLHSIEQIILNLLLNAIQSIDHDRGNIKIVGRYNEKDRKICISISDNGRGIDPAISGKIFDPFVTDKSIQGGMGLGLSISHKLVKAHKGDIVFQSLEGKGTTFSIYFPVDSGVQGS